MKNNYNKPSLKEKYYKFIEVAANHMALFAPFIPALTEMVKQYTIVWLNIKNKSFLHYNEV